MWYVIGIGVVILIIVGIVWWLKEENAMVSKRAMEILEERQQAQLNAMLNADMTCATCNRMPCASGNGYDVDARKSKTNQNCGSWGGLYFGE